MSLFSDEELLGKDESPEDNTEIRVTYLYYSQHEMVEFKKLCKEAMKKEWPEDFQEKGNISDLLLKMLKRVYGNNESDNA